MVLFAVNPVDGPYCKGSPLSHCIVKKSRHGNDDLMLSKYSGVSMTLMVSRRIIKIKACDPNTQRPTLTSILRKFVDTLPLSAP